MSRLRLVLSIALLLVNAQLASNCLSLTSGHDDEDHDAKPEEAVVETEDDDDAGGLLDDVTDISELSAQDRARLARKDPPNRDIGSAPPLPKPDEGISPTEPKLEESPAKVTVETSAALNETSTPPPSQGENITNNEAALNAGSTATSSEKVETTAATQAPSNLSDDRAVDTTVANLDQSKVDTTAAPALQEEVQIVG